MEIILKTDNESSVDQIIALAKKLNVLFEQKEATGLDTNKKEELKNLVRNFKTNGPSSFGDAANWQAEVRKDRVLPFLY